MTDTDAEAESPSLTSATPANAATISTPANHARPVDTADPKRRTRRVRRKFTVTAVALLLAIAAGGSVAALEHNRIWPASAASSNSGVVDNGGATSLATVARRDLTAQAQIDGALGYASTYTVVGGAHGTVTTVPAVGQILNQGQTIYQVDGAPVILLYGSTPLYRNLSENDSGPDVKELNAALVALGYATSTQIDPSSDFFGWQTAAAVERLQDAMGVSQDGILHVGQAVFLPGAIRITSVAATLGAPAGGVIAQATSTSRQVVVQLPATEQTQVKVGDQVVITLPDGRTTPGKVGAIGTVASAPSTGAANGGSGTPTIEVDITPDDPAATGSLDQAPVQVSIVTASVSNVLVVPVNSLLSLAGGGYAVEVAGAHGTHRLVAVTVGLFDDSAGLVQVSGAGLNEGDQVVVAGS